MIWTGACVGSDPDVTPGTSSSGGAEAGASSSSSGGSSGATSSGGGSSSGTTCAASCDGDDLRACDGTLTSCAMGCAAAEGGARCQTFDPSGPLTPADLVSTPGLGVIAFPIAERPTYVDTTTGRIWFENDQNVEQQVRGPNTGTGVEVIDEVAFEKREGLGVFRASSWTLGNTVVQGDHPVAFVAVDSVNVAGIVMATCGQVGGTAANAEAPGNGGAGTANQGVNGAGGGGGGGNQDSGGAGGTGKSSSTYKPGGTRGAKAAFAEATLLRGGSRGGNGGYEPADSPGAGLGGAGGGVVFLVAGHSVSVGDGVVGTIRTGVTPLSSPKGVDVGGCGGEAGQPDSEHGVTSGGGGGSGGTVIVEAPVFTLQANAGLAANGGGGGGYSEAGARARIESTPAKGGYQFVTTNCGNGTTGGDGAAGAVPMGITGGSPANDSCVSLYGGGGGGGGGWIRLRTRAGVLPSASPTAFFSPSAGTSVTRLAPIAP